MKVKKLDDLPIARVAPRLIHRGLPQGTPGQPFIVKRVFRPRAPLKGYLHSMFPGERFLDTTYFVIHEVVTKVKEIIIRDRLYDDRNPELVLCNRSLEIALNTKALHLAEIRDRVVIQLVPEFHPTARDPFPGMSYPEDASCFFSPAPREATEEDYILKRPSLVPHNRQVPLDRLFKVEPDLLAIFRTLDEVEQDREIFSYQELSKFLSRYILAKKMVFFDNRNIKVVIVQGDPLGQALNVRAFHRTQVMTLLRTKLIPI